MNTAYVYSHTHWDREWYLTQRQFQFFLGRTIDEILDLLEARPDFAAFVADGQTIIFHDYCEVRPQNRGRFLKLATEGRLEMGPWYTMPDLWLPSGESIIRNLLLGCLDCESLGLTHTKVGYVPDSFGHIEQMPQIMNGFGISNYAFSRGDSMEGLGAPMQFIWKGPDGASTLTVHRLLDGYGNAGALVPATRTEELSRHIGGILDRAKASSAHPDMALLCNGIDHFWVQADLPEILVSLRGLFPEWEFVHTTLSGYMRAFEATPSPISPPLHTVTGCLHGAHMSEGMLHGTWSSRMDVKLANASAERALVGLAEPLHALSLLCGGRDRSAELGLAWRWLLSNHAHDSICGCSADDTHADGTRRNRHVNEVAEMVAAEALEGLNSQAVRSDKPTLIRYAGLGGAQGCVDFLIDRPSDGSRRPFCFQGADGVLYPMQIMTTRELVRSDVVLDSGSWRHGDSTEFRFAELRGVAWLPEAAPCSVSQFFVSEGAGLDLCPNDAVMAAQVGDSVEMENRLLRVVARKNGTIDVFHKPSSKWYRGLLELIDEGDAGGGYTFRPLPGDACELSSSVPFSVSLVASGPLRARLAMEATWELPKRLSPDRVSRSTETAGVRVHTTVQLDAESGTLSCHTSLDNPCEEHRIRLRMPLPYSTTVVDVERAFVVAHEDMAAYTADAGQNSHPMRDWVSVPSPDARHGLAFVGRGLHEFALTAGKGDAEGSCLAVSLLRCVPFVHDCGTWETPAAQMQGVTEFVYSLVFHEGGWREGGVARAAHRLNSPAVAEVHGSARPSWDDLPHASVKLVERQADDSWSFVSTHRSSWNTVHAERDGWRRWEAERLPDLNVPPDLSPIRIDNPDVLVSALKLAERSPEGGADATGDLIVRLYSLATVPATVSVQFGVPVTQVWEADLSEALVGSELEVVGGAVTLEMTPFQIVTLRVKCLRRLPCATY